MNLSDCQWIVMAPNESNEVLLHLISAAIDSLLLVNRSSVACASKSFLVKLCDSHWLVNVSGSWCILHLLHPNLDDPL